MEHDDHDDHARAPVVQAAHEPSRGDLGQDIAKAAISVAGRRRVVERQHDAGEELDQDQEQRHAAEYLMPAAGGRDLFVQEISEARYAGRCAGQLLRLNRRVFFAYGQACGADCFSSPICRRLFSIFVTIPVERARRGARQHFAVDREHRAVAGADEQVHSSFPVIGASEVSALRPEGHHFVIGFLHYPSRLLFRLEPPAIEAVPAENSVQPVRRASTG